MRREVSWMMRLVSTSLPPQVHGLCFELQLMMLMTGWDYVRSLAYIHGHEAAGCLLCLTSHHFSERITIIQKGGVIAATSARFPERCGVLWPIAFWESSRTLDSTRQRHCVWLFRWNGRRSDVRLSTLALWLCSDVCCSSQSPGPDCGSIRNRWESLDGLYNITALRCRSRPR